MDIVCLASQDWNSHLGVPQQLMARVAADHRVIYVDPPRSLTSALNGWRPDTDANVRHLQVADASKVIRAAAPGRSIPVHNLPLPAARLMRSVNGRFLRGWFRDLLDRHSVTNPVYWVFEPASVQHLPHLPKGPVVYDCIDSWAGYFPEGSRRHGTITDMDTRLTQTADLVFVGSTSLRDSHLPLNSNTHMIHHAADFHHFNQATSEDYPVAEAVHFDDARPVIGLAGILDKRVDTESLTIIAKRHPEWRFAFVGPVQANLDVSALEALENVAMIGMVPASELPAYVKGFDVCLIPYLIDEFVKNIYPLKLHEYLATGRPVVSTSVPAVLPYADLIEIADGADALEQSILAALADTGPDRLAARIELARENSWENRVADKMNLIAKVAHT